MRRQRAALPAAGSGAGPATYPYRISAQSREGICWRRPWRTADHRACETRQAGDDPPIQATRVQLEGQEKHAAPRRERGGAMRQSGATETAAAMPARREPRISHEPRPRTSTATVTMTTSRRRPWRDHHKATLAIRGFFDAAGGQRWRDAARLEAITGRVPVPHLIEAQWWSSTRSPRRPRGRARADGATCASPRRHPTRRRGPGARPRRVATEHERARKVAAATRPPARPRPRARASGRSGASRARASASSGRSHRRARGQARLER